MADSDSRAGHAYFDEEILQWCAALHAPHDAALKWAFDAPSQFKMPAVQLAPSEGKLVELLVRMVRPQRVVELGTLAGYSALRLARAMPTGGKVFTIEFDPRHAAVAREAVERAGVGHIVEVHVGRGVDVLPTLERHGPFDAVFIDADKESYDVYGAWAAKHLRVGGLMLADNAYLFGELLGDSERAVVMRRCHEQAARDFDSVCIPTPDGLLLGLKR